MPFSDNNMDLRYAHIGLNPEFLAVDSGCITSNNFQISYTPPKYGIIKKVEELCPKKVIRVTFINGDVQKAVCSDEDDFDFERGIEVCICKHYLGGTKDFNKQLKQGLKCWDDACEAEMDRVQEEARIAKKKQKRAERKQRKEKQRANEERERQIEIQTEAILRANDIMRLENNE